MEELTTDCLEADSLPRTGLCRSRRGLLPAEAGSAGSPSGAGGGDIWEAAVLPAVRQPHEARNPSGDDNRGTNRLASQCSTLRSRPPPSANPRGTGSRSVTPLVRMKAVHAHGLYSQHRGIEGLNHPLVLQGERKAPALLLVFIRVSFQVIFYHALQLCGLR